jgi:hypothetical protein
MRLVRDDQPSEAGCREITLVPGAAAEGSAAKLLGQGLGEDGSRFLAIGLDQRAEGGEERGMGQRVGIEPVLLGLGEGILDIAIGDAACIAMIFGEGQIVWHIVWEDGHEGYELCGCLMRIAPVVPRFATIDVA